MAPSDGVQERHAVGGQQVPHLGEKTAVVADAHVLEHAHGDDAVVGAGLLAVVAQEEARAPGESRLLGQRPRCLELVRRQGYAGDVDPHFPGQIQRQPAPARADVKDPVARFQEKLGGDVAHFFLLRRLQVFVAVGEVGARILPVGVEKKVVQGVGKVVMAGHVATRPANRVELLDVPNHPGHPLHRPVEGMVSGGAHVHDHQFEEVVEAAVLHRQRAVHGGLAGVQFRAEEELPMQGLVVQPHCQRRRRPGPETVGPAGHIDDAQRPHPNQVGQHFRHQHGSTPPFPPPSRRGCQGPVIAPWRKPGSIISQNEGFSSGTRPARVFPIPFPVPVPVPVPVPIPG